MTGYDDTYAASLARLAEVVENTDDDYKALVFAWLFQTARPETDVARKVHERLLTAQPVGKGHGRAWVRLALLRFKAGEELLAERAFTSALDQLKDVPSEARLVEELELLTEMFAGGVRLDGQVGRVAALVARGGI